MLGGAEPPFLTLRLSDLTGFTGLIAAQLSILGASDQLKVGKGSLPSSLRSNQLNGAVNLLIISLARRWSRSISKAQSGSSGVFKTISSSERARSISPISNKNSAK